MAAARGGLQGGGGHFWWWSRVRRETSFCPAHKSRSFTPPSFHGGRSFRQRSLALHNAPRFNAVRNARAAMGTTAAVGASALVARHVNVTRKQTPCSAHAPHSRTLSNLYRWLFLFISGTARMKQRARPATQSSQSFHPTVRQIGSRPADCCVRRFQRYRDSTGQRPHGIGARWSEVKLDQRSLPMLRPADLISVRE